MRIVPILLVGLLAIPLAAAVVLPPAPENRTVWLHAGHFEDEKNDRRTEIKVGSTVTWVWLDLEHTVTEGVAGQTGAVKAPLFDSGLRWPAFDPITKEPITKFSYTFDQPGVYPYLCKQHFAMRSVVVVTP